MRTLFTCLFALVGLVAMPAWAGTLDDDEAAGIKFMAEEEKLAHDVYLVFQRKYSERVFPNIRRSEQNHMAAMDGLLERYALQDPKLPGVGRFTDASLQALYDKLISAGSKNRIEAIKAGAFIEETDIQDIAELIGQTDEWAIKRVYANLLDGSKSHLRAFVSRLQRLGVEYRPSVLSDAEYKAIVGG